MTKSVFFYPENPPEDSVHRTGHLLMGIDTGKFNRLGQLALSALTGAVIVCAALFGGWFFAFIIMRFVGTSMLVGMNYLAWPIAFPLFSFPVIFLLLLVVIPFFRQPYPEILAHKGFLFAVMLPVFLVAMALMLATCPLETGGTLLTDGWKGFSSQ